MRSFRQAIVDEILPGVSKPSRYIGMEWNAVRKDPAATSVKIALAFPDTYEIGMSHVGLKILYQILNRRPEFMTERVYAPWPDAEALLRRGRIPLCTLESGYSLADFDLIGFTLQYELSYTTILNMLDLAGVPLGSAERREGDPFVIAGGSVGFNPEPIAEFIDLFVLGDGEEVVLEVCEAAAAWKASGGRRDALLEAWARIPGCYVPALHQGETIRKRTAIHLDGIDYGAFPVPFMEIVHDRVSIEVMRGCTQGCRFCQAGYLYRPLRERSAEEIQQLAVQAVRQTGYEEVSLASLSIADLTVLPDVVPALMDRLLPEKISLSLPSLRVETLNRFPQVAEEISRVRKTGFTIAPEAGSSRLRKVINKEGFDEEQIFTAVRNAARAGWESVKFYFIIGLPTETQEDLDEIVRITRESARIARAESTRGFGLTVSTSSFVPKPHTPFQWCAQEPMEMLKDKQEFLRRKFREIRVSYKWHNVQSSFLEAVFSLGDRSLGRVVRRGYELGCRFDGWTEHLKFDRWMQAFDETGIDPRAFANRPRNVDEPLPWDHIDSGVNKAFLQREYKKAMEVRGTPDCHTAACTACGEICMPSWPTWAEQVGMTVSSDKCQAASPRCVDPASGLNTQHSTLNTLHEAPVQRIRCVFQKIGMLRFLSHLELMRALGRALRRAGIALAYSQGFNPQPKLSCALALPVGVEGRQELADIELRVAMAPEELVERVNRCLAAELQLLRAWEVPLTAPSLTTSVREAAYRVSLPLNGCAQEIGERLRTQALCDEWLDRPSIPVSVERKERRVEVDARPQIRELVVLGEEEGALCWDIHLSAGQGGGVRPHVIMAHLLKETLNGRYDGWETKLRVARTALILDGDQ
ncbi:MAG: TIGR03960 family B12-binding radical SAM protein [Candidatus Methylomirabilis oxygeniifera]|uniref:Radical SAM domain protein n=1 Tax=Methylomirabilis oxygeniifera TaxID=671143 RepID=D5MHC2_METO1|nr:MAG: TIGR03960 family B12-binding radical SAM protein [Candidatus Methylomirabilis oxyfera]CBE69154.1 Radical SAM domain protein [Candidatus Methylomirabilis oxyfera]